MIFLILYIIFMPLIAVRRDRSDYNTIKQEVPDIENLLRKIAVLRKKPIDEILYRVRVISMLRPG